MKLRKQYLLILCVGIVMSSCVSTKKFSKMKDGYERSLAMKNELLEDCNNQLTSNTTSLGLREQQLTDLRDQLADVRTQRDKQVTQVGDLAVLSQSASDNIKQTLNQLQQRDRYIHLLHAAKSKADSINLALALNLKTVLQDGIDDKDVEIKVDKTVVFIDLSDKMLYQSGSYKLTKRAHEVLAKIARIIESRPDFEVMIEGYTDNDPIKTACIEDNWDLSVKRATSVVRVLQNDFNINPNRLIAAGRGENNIKASNDTAAGKAANRRTRIIILPKLDQFYDLLDPAMATKPLD